MPRKSPHTHVPKSLLHCLQQLIATTTKAAPTPVLRAGRMRTACSVGGGRGGENVSQKPALLAAFLPPFSSEALNSAISHTGRTYEAVGEMFAEQPKNDLFQMLDMLSLYQGLLSNFPDIIHLQKGKSQCRLETLTESALC